MTARTEILHATTVAIAGHAAVILGPSGAGKSSLALRLISLGAVLVADDRTTITRRGDALIADAPPPISGLIEARGLGLLRLPIAASVPVALFIDLAQAETDRLPAPHVHSVLGLTLPCLHNADSAHFPAALYLYMRHSRGGYE